MTAEGDRALDMALDDLDKTLDALARAQATIADLEATIAGLRKQLQTAADLCARSPLCVPRPTP